MRVLWLMREAPFPTDQGDRIYSLGLVRALAATGVRVEVLCLAGDAPPVAAPNLAWRLVPGPKRARLRAAASLLPLNAAIHCTPAFRAALRGALAEGGWDGVVLDHYGTAWAIDALAGPHRPPVLVHVSHNHEAALSRQQWRESHGGIARRGFLLANHLRVARLEHRAVAAADVVTAITPEDAAALGGSRPPLVLLPGYDGRRVAARRITAALPARALLFGSFRWSVKQENLRQLLDLAAPLCGRDKGAGIQVVGNMDAAFRDAMRARHPGFDIVGYAEDPAAYFDAARAAILAEPIGGGFKLKIPELAFHRVPMLAIAASVAGVPDALRAHIHVEPDAARLFAALPALLADTARLDALQEGAFRAAVRGFDWSDRGQALRAALVAGQAALPVAASHRRSHPATAGIGLRLPSDAGR